MDEVLFSNSLSVISSDDIAMIHHYSKTIGVAVIKTSEAIQEFLDWMNIQQRPAQWFRQVAIEFSQGLQKSLEGKTAKHIQNVERTVWQIIETPGWIFYTTNTTRNQAENIRCLEALASRKPESVTEVDEVSDSLQLCTKCRKYGSLVICSGQSCLNRYHWKCSGVKPDEVGDGEYFCQVCIPSFVADIQSKRRADNATGEKSKGSKKSRPRPSKGARKKKKDGGDTSMQQDGSEHIHLHDSGNEDDDCGVGGPATAAVEKSGAADGAGGVVAAESTDVADEGESAADVEGDSTQIDPPVSRFSTAPPGSLSFFGHSDFQGVVGGLGADHIIIQNAAKTYQPSQKIQEKLHFLQMRLAVLEQSVVGMSPMALSSISMKLSEVESLCHESEHFQYVYDGFDDVNCGQYAATRICAQSSHGELAPSWTLPQSLDESPEFNSHLMLECQAHMQHAWDSVRSRCWGRGSDEDVKKLPVSWFDSALISRCLSAFSFLARDIFFIDPDYCDTILIHENTMEWPKSFLRDAKQSKFNFVVAFVSLQQMVGLRVTGNRGYHWIVVVGDLQKRISWVYDPADSSLATDSYTREVGILSKFMRAVRPTESVCFKQEQCPFKFQCQDVKEDSQHCGLWCVFYTMNLCLGTLPVYERLCTSAKGTGGLAKFALKLKKHLYSDIVRHKYLLDMSFVDIWQSPTINHSHPINDFWTITPVNFFDFCQMRFSSNFSEMDRHFQMRVADGPPPLPHQRVMFISNGIFVIKVYRFLWGKISEIDLAQALHETAATAYVCLRKKKWYFDVFGVVTAGVRATYVYICVCRKMLDHTNAPLSHNPFVKLYEKTGVAHGDGHSGNVMNKRFCKHSFECIDFERSFLPNSTVEPAAIIVTIHSYYEACSDEVRSRILINAIKNQGLERTRANFRHFARACLKEDAIQYLFYHGKTDFLKIFERREV